MVGGGAVRPREAVVHSLTQDGDLRERIPLARDPSGTQRTAARPAGGWRRTLEGVALRALAGFSREAAVRRGARLLLEPPRRPLTEAERAVFALARRESAPTAAGEFPIWVWQGASYRPPTVLLVHDWGGRAADLAAFVAPLRREGARVVAFDAPAHGEASGHQLDVIELTAMVAALLRRHSEWAPPRGIVAHGFGALAATLAVATGGRAERLVYLAAAENFDPYLDSFRRETGLDEELLESVRQCVERRVGRTLESVRGARLARELERPLLAFHDADDAEVDWEHSRRLVDRWTGARLVRTFGLGHRGLLQRDAVVAATVEHLMAEPTASGGAARGGG